MKKLLTIAFLLSLGIVTNGQISERYIQTKNIENIVEKDSISVFENTKLMNTGIISVRKAFIYSKNDTIKRIYEIKFHTDSLESIRKSIYVNKIYDEDTTTISMVYQPSDYMWNCYNNQGINYLWHLRKIKADQAWDVTHGDSNVKIAIIDTWFDINHPDLANQMYCNYDPYDNTMFSSNPSNSHHGTTVASFAAAQTDGGGQLAGIGFNCKIVPYRIATYYRTVEKAQHASFVMNADVITSSASCWNTNLMDDSDLSIIIREILDNGTAIVMPAGNGPTGTHNPAPTGGDQPFYPFHPNFDERIIIVSSTDTLDYHTFIDSNNTDHTHSHYADVDICAPGYNTMGAMCTQNSDGSPNTWPYYGFCVGTSFATPIVAGVCALIKSVNKCLSPADIQHIIKTTADPIADANLYPGLVGAGRINAYQALIMAKSYSDTVHISSNTTWASERKVHGHIVIDSLATLTVTDTLKLGKDVKIIIKPAGKLVVDGGVITNLCCDDMWDGIYIVGDSTKRQLAQYQGTLVVKNGSVIENARVAVNTWDGTNFTTTGGIVQCSNSTFRNNGRSISFYRYTNHNASGNETDNVSYAQKCTFVVNDNNNFSSNNVSFEEFVWITHVRGVSFKGSSFRDDRATTSTQTKGINSDGAGFNASEHCSTAYNSNAPCTCPAIETRTRFSRLGYGIYATNDGSTYNFTADHAIFDTCYRAVLVSAVNNHKVTRSDFDMSTSSTFSNGSARAVSVNNCSGYTVEGNTIGTEYSTRPSGYTGIGIYVYNSGTDANTIYRNTMNNMYQGICTDGSNSGLQLQCNEFTDNFFSDISIFNSISGSQGSSTKSAGNKFSGVKKIYSPSTYITYYHSGANNSSNVYCPNNSSATIVRVPNITANDCASTICIPLNLLDPIKSLSADDITLYESLQQIYESRLTEYTAAGYDFLLENFDENDADIVAIARLKQDTLISLSRTMAEIANRNLNAILADSVLDRESLNGWYNRINTQTAKYSLANSYFEIGEYALASQELAAIPQHFALSADELAEYDNFCDYNALRESVFTSGRNYAQLTEEEIAELEAIADLNTGVSSAYANSVLCFFYGICREIDEAEIDDTPMNNKNAVASVEENSERESLAVYVYPNPADEELNILLNSMPEGTTIVEFHDVTGRLVLFEEIKSANTSINISSLRQGVYMYRIVNGDNIIARDRIVKE